MSSQRLIYLRDIGFEALAISQDLANKTHILPRKLVCRILSKSTPNYGNLNTHFERDNISLFNILKALKLHLNCRISNGYIGYSFLSRLGKISLLIDNVSKKTANMISLVFKAFKLMFGYLLCFAPTKAPRLSKRSKYKILMIGGYGSKDIGDEAMPHADVMNLRKSFGDDLEIVMLSPDPQNTTKTHKAKSIQDIPELGFSSGTDVTSKLENILSALYGLAFLLATALSHRGIHLRLWPNARSILNELKASDMVFNVGGGNLNSIIPQELYKKGLIYLSAMILHKPVVLSGQTIGPFENNMDRRFAQLSLNSVDSIYFRDKGISQQRCHEIGIFKPRMVDAADDAMTIPFIKKEKAKKLLLLEAGQKWHHMKSQLAVAMNFKGSLRLFRKRGKLSDLSRECQLMAEIADAMVTIFRAKILFIPTDYSTGVDDRDLHQEIIRKTRHSESIGAIEGEYDDTTLKGLIGLFDIAIGSRYHFCVFAASMLVPFAGLASGTYQKTKLKGLSELCDLPNCFIEKDMSTAKFNEVWPNIKWVMDNKCFIKNRLAQMVPLLNTRSLYGVERAVKLMRTA